MNKNSIIFLDGNQVFSDFRKIGLLGKIQKIVAKIKDIESSYLHAIESNQSLNNSDLDKLKKLLDYGPKNIKSISDHNSFFIGPRIGTISPWSSRATDIAKHCNIPLNKIERCISIKMDCKPNLSEDELMAIAKLIYDQMTEDIFLQKSDIKKLFTHQAPKPINHINILEDGLDAIRTFSVNHGLALSDDEISYLYNYFVSINRNPTDAELMMFAQANSEHCRHKIFNAKWTINHEENERSLFQMIKNTHEITPQKTVVAYSDNSSIVEGKKSMRFYTDHEGHYKEHEDLTHYLMKVETHNHPTAISPFAGAATGAGGEIRDEGATGRGSKPKAGLSGFSVSNLRIPDYPQSWEKKTIGKPSRIASPLQIMIDGPIGAASYNNEFGRPNIAGYFRTLEIEHQSKWYGYHKPIMLAGGVGNILDKHTHKHALNENDLLIQLGGPAMLIGLGGGAASSMDTGSNLENLDFDSVQRGNPELQRRAQEVIDRCWQMHDNNPILSIHDVGAGGLSNAFPELINDGGVGAVFNLRDVNNEEPGMSPKEIWCNEAQERYVLAIKESDLERFKLICERERCPFAVVGRATKDKKLLVKDNLLKEDVVNMDLGILLGKPPKMEKNVIPPKKLEEKQGQLYGNLSEDLERVLNYPAVANKNFLITIGDRSVTGLISRDQMIGPWQVPVSDVAVTKLDFTSYHGEAFAVGEKTPLAIIDAPASARMAVGEAITNITASNIPELSSIKLSANWMAATGQNDQDYELFEAVKTIGMDLCPQLSLSIPVGKDSLSMQTKWNDKQDKSVQSPLSVIISAFSECSDTRKTLTPQLQRDQNSTLIFIDLGEGKNRLAGSSYLLSQNEVGKTCPDLEDSTLLKNFFSSIQKLNQENKLLAYHDRSDGGLIITLLEMAFAGRCGIDIQLDQSMDNAVIETLFNEELGAVIQVSNQHVDEVEQWLKTHITEHIFKIGKPDLKHTISIKDSNANELYQSTRSHLQKIWSSTSYHMQTLRDNPKSAHEEFVAIEDDLDPGIQVKLSFEVPEKVHIKKTKPKIAVLREQGVNGQNEMAAAFYYAGFDAHDVHMSDLMTGRLKLSDFQAMVACGGFSYGDVLGAGQGWGKSILFNEKLKGQFQEFFNQKNKLTLGVCNGCQMLSSIKEIIPGTDYWPSFVKNESEQFEARFVSVEIQKTNSPFFNEMQGSILPIAVAHGEGRIQFDHPDHLDQLVQNGLAALNYVDHFSKGTLRYPLNPNGSEMGITGITNFDGSVTIMMPHPERVFLADQNSWYPKDWNHFGPWYKMFANANLYFN
jgi:phosphoribosylformylglycinamidine synthase